MQASAQALDGFQGHTEYNDLTGTSFLCTYAPLRPARHCRLLGRPDSPKQETAALAPLRNAVLRQGLLSLIIAGLALLLLRQSRAVDLRTLQVSAAQCRPAGRSD